MEFIKGDINYRVDAHNIIKSVLVDEQNNPILRKNLLPKIKDKSIIDSLDTDNVIEVERLPDVGEECKEGIVYLYSNDTESYSVFCRQTHDRTIYEPKEVPNLFTYFRENSDDLEWIPNELVKNGWKRWYNEVQYEMIQPSEILTVVGQTPDKVPALWSKVITDDIVDWFVPTSTNYYTLNQLMRYTDGKVYESLISVNVYSPVTYPAGWKLRSDLS